MAMNAAKAGEDMYCEKPCTKNIAQSLILRETMRRTARVFQVGTMQRTESEQRFLKAIALVRDGRIGTVDPATGTVQVTELGEGVYNSLAVDEQGVYVVTDIALYRMSADAAGKPREDWRAAYDRGAEQKPGQLSLGSGTTPTVLPGGRVAITDNADPRMNVAFYDTGTGEEICHAPVFGAGASATENSLVSVGDGVIVENNYGYGGPQSTLLGRATSGGLARVDLDGDECSVAWTSDEVATTSVPKVSLETGLLYAYTKRPTWWGVSAWYLTAVDARTARAACSRGARPWSSSSAAGRSALVTRAWRSPSTRSRCIWT